MHWKSAFPGQEWKFHFGGRTFIYTQNSGYFWDRRGEIISVFKKRKGCGPLV